MQAFFLEGIETLVRREADPPPVGDDDVLVRTHTAGICGSDIEYFLHNRIGSFVPKGPLVLGHEFAGEVVEVGSRVDRSLIGRRIAADPSIPCRRCRYCRIGRHNLCESMRFIGTAASVPHISGGFGEYVALPAVNCHVVPDNLSWGEAACLEPLAVALHAGLRPGSIAGANVLVTGGGTIGQFVALVARALGAATISVSDPMPFRRSFAVDRGADYGIDPTDATSGAGQSMEDCRKAVGGYDVIFEASGAPAAVASSLELINRGGTIVQIGSIGKNVDMPMNLVMAKEVRMLGSFRYGEVYQTAMSFLASRRTDVRPLITRTFGFDETPEAFGLAAQRGETVKVQVSVA